MATNSVATPKGGKGRTVSSLSDFAEIFVFLQNLGPLLKLGGIKLADLENFFTNGWQHTESDKVVHIQWRLLRYAVRNGGKEDWQRMAIKFACKVGLLGEAIPYQDASLQIRMKIFRLSCEEQFDTNPHLRDVKRDSPGMLTRPIGVDRSGLRYWLLQDSAFDVRLYSEGCYDDAPPAKPSWSLLAWSLDELANQICLLESRRPDCLNSADSSLPTFTDIPTSSSRTTPTPDNDPGADLNSRKRAGSQQTSDAPAKKKGGSKTAQTEDTEEAEGGGCLKCRKDVDYKHMLLCDGCDRECHTYCQYPVLWVIPRGKWMCPVCKEGELLSSLKAVYLHLSQARMRHEQQLARQERSVARLQKSGVLLQNILDVEEQGSRSRRSRKAVNYAELNDVYLPPLGPGDVVGKEDSSYMRPSTRKKRIDDSYVQEDYLAPRVRNTSRRFRGQPPGLETVKEAEKSQSPENDDHTIESAEDLILGEHRDVPGGYESGSGSSSASVQVEEDGEDLGHDGDDEQESEGSIRAVDSPPASFGSSGCGSEGTSDELVVAMPLPPSYGVDGRGLNQYPSLGRMGPNSMPSGQLGKFHWSEPSRGSTHIPQGPAHFANAAASGRFLHPAAPYPLTMSTHRPTHPLIAPYPLAGPLPVPHPPRYEEPPAAQSNHVHWSPSTINTTTLDYNNNN